ncbi:Piso0_001086 [Millerozyma farinosa CBS 7064]|uniref:Piso0_001086 protein n=1 Tax=Pichia sorbitophila (strain ATCC MYA-4447 / BCRC 22081 / CBS 7064 / NBRC 10061 / NRRL Y-12695) TaxID=559304 RepID=G8YQW4_PICSO|nr:Piso0_001086 [Millerozyma farinosa CBS 7064]CCE79049.1 Piso0_001086 [Millerozyma farinosa CBS 7064]
MDDPLSPSSSLEKAGTSVSGNIDDLRADSGTEKEDNENNIGQNDSGNDYIRDEEHVYEATEALTSRENDKTDSADVSAKVNSENGQMLGLDNHQETEIEVDHNPTHIEYQAADTIEDNETQKTTDQEDRVEESTTDPEGSLSMSISDAYSSVARTTGGFKTLHLPSSSKSRTNGNYESLEGSSTADSPANENDGNIVDSSTRGTAALNEMNLAESKDKVTQAREDNKANNDDNESILKPLSVKRERRKKRVAGKYIENFWKPLNSQNHKTFSRIIDMSINKTLEKYMVNKERPSKRLLEAQACLSKEWPNTEDPKSFISRLKHTNVPPASTMQTSSKFNPRDLDVLDHDALARRLKYLETYLSAELKQLSDLEKYYSDLEFIYKSDDAYSKDFDKTVSANVSSMHEKLYQKKSELSISDIADPENHNIVLVEKHNSRSETYDPDNDIETKNALALVNRTLKKSYTKLSHLSKLNDELEELYNIIDT